MSIAGWIACQLILFVPAVDDAAVPAIRDVRHEPAQPKPNHVVLVTARVPAESTKVILKLQPIAPGKYLRKDDPAFAKEWLELPMRDDGKDGDAKAGDGIYSARVPSKLQQHRWLIRYQIVAVDRAGKATTSPDKDDSCPNYAWWCDAGPATWKGSREPGKAPPEVYSSAFLGTMQSIHLLARAEDVERSQWDGNAHKQKMPGTIVYRGVVYDHIQFSNRGQASAHISGKNKWSLKLNRGHETKLYDHDGNVLTENCRSLNLNPGGSTPHLPVHRGITGLDEVLSMRAYRLAGVPSPFSTWIQWRVVTAREEVNARDQYKGDLWGIYAVIGEMEPKFLANPKLADGLTVSIQSGIKHTPDGMENADKVWEKFVVGMRSNPTEDWWRKNLDLQAYFSFHALNRLMGNVDLRPDGNHGYYRHPDGRWAPIPWDNDMMFVPRHHQPGFIEAIGCLNQPNIALEYRNRAREILDLFASDRGERGGQIGQLTAQLGAALTPKGYSVNWPRLDQAVWNFHPRMNQKGSYFINPSHADHFGGPWDRKLATNDFAGFQKYIVDFCTDCRPVKNYAPNDGDQRGYGWGYLNHEAKDDKIPATPKVERVNPEAFRFKASAFASPAGHPVKALEWRVGRVGAIGQFELTDLWRKDSGTNQEFTIPAEPFKEPGTYRVRARWRDGTGRCGHWSEPVEITVKKPE